MREFIYRGRTSLPYFREIPDRADVSSEEMKWFHQSRSVSSAIFQVGFIKVAVIVAGEDELYLMGIW